VNLLSFWLYASGAVLFVVTWWWAASTPAGRSTPLQPGGARGLGILLALSAVFLAGFSSILTGVNFIASIHRLRPRAWAGSSCPSPVGALRHRGHPDHRHPVLGITAAMGFMDRIFHLGLFMPSTAAIRSSSSTSSGSTRTPAVYIMILPAMGVVSEVVSVFSRKPSSATASSP